MNGKRKINIDYLKAIAIFGVVYTHFWFGGGRSITVDNIIGYLLNTLCALAVPSFFIINGFFLFGKNFDVKKHVRKTLILIMALFFWTVLYNLVFGKVYDFPGTKDLAKDLLYGKCTIIPGFTITNWFFFALLGIYVLFPFLKKSLDDVSSFEYYKYFIGYLLLLFFGSNIICRLGNLVLFVFGIKSFPLNMMLIFPRLNIIFENGYALVYFIVGGLISKNYDKIMTLNKSKLVLGIVIGVIVNYAYGLIYTFNSTGSFDNMYNNVWNGYPSISILVASSCLVLLVLNMEKEQKCDVSLFDRVAVIVSNNTMGIYFFHLLIGNLINCYYKQYAQWCISLPYVFLIFVLSLLCSILVSKTPVIRKMVKF